MCEIFLRYNKSSIMCRISPCNIFLDIYVNRLIVNVGMLVPTAKTTNAAASRPVRTAPVLRNERS
jgi:hypothetical protein